MKALIRRSTPIVSTFRTSRVQGMYDIPTKESDELELTVDLPIEEQPWQIGVITGASGSGKTTIAQEVFGEEYRTSGQYDWGDGAIVDAFKKGMTPQQITSLLTSVGLSSAPAWLRPYNVLSTGQQFRADLARALSEVSDGPIVFDEFTSTVDRTVAAAVSVSVAKAIRRGDGQFVAVTCHRDVVDWLQPDWVYDTDSARFIWGSVQPRPQISLVIREGAREAWPLFRNHHYLTGSLSPAARVWLVYVRLGDTGEERLAGFFSILPVAGFKGWWRFHRSVVLPDFQGMGIGSASQEIICERLWVDEKKRMRSTTSSPALVEHRRRSPKWGLASAPKMNAVTGKTSTVNTGENGRMVTSAGRLTTNWVYVPEEFRQPSGGTTQRARSRSAR